MNRLAISLIAMPAPSLTLCNSWDNFQDLRLHVHPPVGHEFFVVLAGHLPQGLPGARVLDHAQERHENLRQAWLNRAVCHGGVNLPLAEAPKSEHEEFIAKLQGCALVFARQV